MRKILILATAALALGAIGSVAQATETTSAPASGTTTASGSTTDPNRTICRKIEVVGSRLRAQRVCQTAAEWDAQRAADRQSIERSQTQRTKSE